MLVGKAGSGKDTIGNIIAELTNANVIALADPLKHLVRSLYGFSDEQLWGSSEKRSVPSTFKAGDLQQIFMGSRLGFKLPIGWKHLKDQNRALEALMKYGFQEYNKFDENDEIELTPRKVLQGVGNQIRDYAEDFWININLDMVHNSLSTGFPYDRIKDSSVKTKDAHNLVVVPDGRYRSEIMAAKRSGFLVIKIVNPDDKSIDNHVSETEIDTMADYFFDIILSNDRACGLKGLKRAVRRIVEEHVFMSVYSTSCDWVGNGL